MTASNELAPFRSSGLARRIAITVIALAVYRAGCHVPLPGLNTELLASMAGSTLWTATVERMSVMALGMTPWFSALALWTIGVIAARRLAGAAIDLPGLDNPIPLPALLLGLVFATGQAIGLAVALDDISGAVSVPGPAFRAGITASLVAGTVVGYLMARVITEHGIGGGLWVLLFIPAMLDLPDELQELALAWSSHRIESYQAMLALAVPCAAAAVTVTLLEMRRGAGPDTATRILWPGLLATTSLSLILTLAMALRPEAVEALAMGLAPRGMAHSAAIGLLTFAFARLMEPTEGPQEAPLATALTLALVVVLPALAYQMLGVPMLLEGPWIVALVAVLFSLARMWQRPTMPIPQA